MSIHDSMGRCGRAGADSATVPARALDRWKERRNSHFLSTHRPRKQARCVHFNLAIATAYTVAVHSCMPGCPASAAALHTGSLPSPRSSAATKLGCNIVLILIMTCFRRL